MKDYKVLMAPVNISGQPKMLVEGLKKIGVDARLFQYGKHKFGYESDIVVEIGDRDRSQVQLDSLASMLEMDFDIFHFWFRTFYFGSYYNSFPGFDLPLIKASGKRILYRFTGYDLRMSSLEMEMNPWHAYQYGFEPLFDEDEQKKYLDYLNSFVDEFIVQDIEMESYLLAAGLPKPTIIPRSLDLEQWPFVGVQETKKPLVIHAPSNSVVKGTPFILQAVQELQEEGLEFAFKLIQNMPHEEASKWYKKCDLAVDQILIGWYGVFSMDCMALGKPVIVYVRDDLIERSDIEIPVLNANPSSIKDVMRDAISDLGLRKKYSVKQRAYIENVHDVNHVAESMNDCYQRILGKPIREANPSLAIPHMEHQMKKLKAASPNKVFRTERSGVSFNQNHKLFRVAKRFKMRLNRLMTDADNKKETIHSFKKSFFSLFRR